MQIKINGRVKQFAGIEITYENIIQLAFDLPTRGPLVLSYHGQGKSGTLNKGEKVKCEPGMVFDVYDAGIQPKGAGDGKA
jgi:hypothetical protein